MSAVERRMLVTAPRGEVWRTIAALERVAEWNPNVASASCGARTGGLGARRTCVLAPSGRLEEVVAVWDERREVRFAIGRHGGIRSAEMGLALDDEPEGTEVVADIDYHLAFGPLGPVMDRIAVRGQITRMLDRSLTGLRDHVERNRQGA